MKVTVRDLDLNNKKVLIRCDFNVPIVNGIIEDDTRIVKSLATIKYVLSKNAKVILLSHLGRVKCEEDKKKLDLAIVGKRLSELLNKEVIFASVTRGEELEQKVNNMNYGDILLIQNTRYEDLDGKKESSCDEELSKYWASLGDVFINDAFGTIHRAHASNVGISKYLESGIGFLVENELNKLSVLNSPLHEFNVIMGGAKVSDKIGVIENLINKCDHLLIGGGMAYTFLKAKGMNIGNSLLDEENIEFCKKMLELHKEKIILPIDHIVSKGIDDTEVKIKDISDINSDEMGLDIGPKTISLFKDVLKMSKTILWNGPLGYSEVSYYENGTKDVLKYIVDLNVTSILGGGDIVAASSRYNLKDKVFHASTGGGATLCYLEGKELPGLKYIKDKEL